MTWVEAGKSGRVALDLWTTVQFGRHVPPKQTTTMLRCPAEQKLCHSQHRQPSCNLVLSGRPCQDRCQKASDERIASSVGVNDVFARDPGLRSLSNPLSQSLNFHSWSLQFVAGSVGWRCVGLGLSQLVSLPLKQRPSEHDYTWPRLVGTGKI